MYHRVLANTIRREKGDYPVIAITGSRQSGKPTLVRELFPSHQYVLLEDPDLRQQAIQDPRAFFRRFSGPLILDEVQKANGEESNLYFWRDQKGHEIDLVYDRGSYLHPIEIKSSETFHSSFLKNLDYLTSLQKSDRAVNGECIYGGNESFEINNWQVCSWKDR